MTPTTSNNLSSADDEAVRALISSRQPGHALPGPFSRDPAVHRADMQRIWRRGWLFAGHSLEAQKPGDYFLYRVEDEELVIIRGDDGKLNALYNTCRHRGSLVVVQPAGRLNKLVCPYHKWTYDKDGCLAACKGMHDGLDTARLGLGRAHVEECEGLVFVSLADTPLPFAAARAEMAPLLSPQGFARGKIAKIVDYVVEANWKLVWENNRECYHCVANHPEYIRANWDHVNEMDAPEHMQRSLDAEVKRGEAKWKAQGLAGPRGELGLTKFPDAENDVWWSANRTPLVPGWVSESLDGKQVSKPLMGDYPDADVGTLRMRTLPNFWNHSSADHGVSTRLTPEGPRRTLVRLTWLVAAGAVEGKDYELATLMPFWMKTAEQDRVITEVNQRGVDSRHFKPGPYSTHKEYNVDSFMRWYLGWLGRP